MPRAARFSTVILIIAFSGHVPGASVDFVRDVRPILETHCFGCHGAMKQKSGLRLDIRSEAFEGGEVYGPAIVPGKPVDSPLIQLISGEDEFMVMPPQGERLSAAEVATLTAWIAEGALWPDGVDDVTQDDPANHWAFRPLTNPAPPEPNDSTWAQNTIDRFVLSRLEQEGLCPASEADRATWLRRVTFDLTGLPPTPERLAAFVADPRGDAHARVVDELLASPHYGERWAQHWLDVVRYADTHGFEVNTERPNAWPYRDYVIRAFNVDLPYDRFVREQIVGDLLGEDAATGFLVTASVLLPGQIGQDEPSKRLARQDALDEIVNNTGSTFLAMSLSCARCHDHKFDPVSQADYYGMQAFFAGVEYGDRPLRTPEAEAARREDARLRARRAEVDSRLASLVPRVGAVAVRPSVNPRLNTDRFAPVAARRLRFTIHETNRLEPCLDELEVFDMGGRNVALDAAGATVRSSGNTLVADRHELRFVNDGLYGNARSWMSNEPGRGWIEIEFPTETTIDRVVWGRDREGQFQDRLATVYRIEVAVEPDNWHVVADSTDRRTFVDSPSEAAEFSTEGLDPEEALEAHRLQEERSALDARIAQVSQGQVAFAGVFRTPDTIHKLLRGDPEQPRDEIGPAVPWILGAVALSKDAPEPSRREALAEWIASPDNPLTARVMVNRIWQGHFGTGIVETPSDFGRNGAAPSHPELLDWLATEFIRSGWSVKHMHRLIVLSATYRQSSRIDLAAQAKDAGVRLLWRFPSRRLEAEAIRDAMLAVSGRLNAKRGGPGFDFFLRRGGLEGFPPIESFGDEGRRRMIYAHKVRRERDPVFGAFDCPDAGQSTSRRLESTTPLQALNLFNSRFTLDESMAMAKRIETEVGDDVIDQVGRAYRLALGRDPAPSEIEDAMPIVRGHGLTTLCRAVLNCNEFLLLP